MFKLPHYTSDIMVLKKFTPLIVVLVKILIVLLIKLGLFSTFVLLHFFTYSYSSVHSNVNFFTF